MAELTTDAQALSEASTNFDGITSFFLFEDSAPESGAGMQDTEKGVTGMFASAGDAGGETAQKLASIWGGSGSDAYQSTQQRWDSTSEAATNFDRISGDLKSAIAQVDAAADDAASSLGTSMGFTPPDDGFDFKAMEAGEAASNSLKYNFGGIDGAADGAKGGNVEFEWKVEEGESSGDVFDLATEAAPDGIPATLAEWAVLLA